MEPGDTELLIQATAVAIAGRGLVVVGPPGSGKSSLALALIDRGAMLIGDDGVRLRKIGAGLIAEPPPNIRGKLEIRNVGIVTMPTSAAPVSLVLELDPNAPRFVDHPQVHKWLECDVPRLRFHAQSAGAAIKAEYALRIHGLAIAGDEAE